MAKQETKKSKTDIVMGWLFIAAIAFICGLQFGCNTVAGLGKDIQATAEGIRQEMAKE